MTNKSLTKIEKLKKQKEVITARIQKMEAIEKHKERKQDTRRKILIGSYFLDKMKKDGTLDSLKKDMDKFLKRDSDRVLFDLEPIKSK